MDFYQRLKIRIQDIPNFPKEGVGFKDIMPLFRDGPMLQETIKHMADLVRKTDTEYIVAIESRGFLIGAPLAFELGMPFVPARKKGKLPGKVLSQIYDLEYGQDTIEMQSDSLKSGGKYMLVDDVIATGGTANAVSALLRKHDCLLSGFLFLIELEFLKGSEILMKNYPEIPMISLLHY